MFLAIDIGNTRTKFGVYDRDSLINRFAVPTDSISAVADFSRLPINQTIRHVVASTVVPELKKVYREFCARRFSVEPFFVDNRTDFGLKINYSPPDALGADRLVAAFAAIEKYSETCIVCDFGTATTIDVVTKKREFLGGIIAPGINLMSEALRRKTAQLPQIEIEKPARVVGDSTVSAIRSGVYFGAVGAVEGIVERMKRELGIRAKVVATGGFARLIAAECPAIDRVDDDLLLEGLRLVYEKRRR